MKYAVRYCTTTGIEHVKVTGDQAATYVFVGQVLYSALREGRTLSYVNVVNCRKRPGTKPVFRMARDVMTDDQLRNWCKWFHDKAYRAYAA